MIDCRERRGIVLPVPTIASDLHRTQAVRRIGCGSTVAGRLLMQRCADHVRKVSLELGGDAPFIVFDGPDLDIAAA